MGVPNKVTTPQIFNFGEIMGEVLIVTKSFSYDFQKGVLSFIFLLYS